METTAPTAPYEMTLREYAVSRLPASIAARIPEGASCNSFRPQHKREIIGAMERGNAIPARVLAEYPELA